MWLAALLAAATVVSAAPADVAVTLYRAGDDTAPIDRARPTGYALVTETRTIALPAGEAVVRFEGVADAMLAESAIVTGLPAGVVEKNRDARLLSPASLIDAGIGRHVHLRRTDRATGRVREQDAILRAGPGNGVVLETAEGVEALGCSGLPERLSHDGAPPGLSARPVLSILTSSPRATVATVTLSYLAEAFDWRADYVVQLDPGGRTLDLFAWGTLANGGGQGFERAAVQAVAGRIDRGTRRIADPPQPRLVLACYPLGTTSDRHAPPPPPPPPPAPAPAMMMAEDIVVTAQKAIRPQAVMIATQEELGDLKLYRVPEPVTLAARSTKQVAMIDRRDVPYLRVYAGRAGDAATDDAPLGARLRLRNRAEDGLGLPLPAGHAVLFGEAGDRAALVGESEVAAKAVGEEVELAIGPAPPVRLAVAALVGDRGQRRYRATVTNALDVPAAIEIAIPFELAGPAARLPREHGVPIWRATVPAGGTARLDYSVRVRD